MRYRVLPYRQGSKGAKALATALGGKVLKLEGSTFIPKAGDVVINWGNVDPSENVLCCLNDGSGAYLLNYPSLIRKASNKLVFFQTMAKHEETKGLTPRFWENQNDIPDDAFPIVCRTVLAGHSGDGIVIAATRGDLVPAPLYVEYVKKQDEYRIHVGMDYLALTGDAPKVPMVISVQRKARRTEVPDNEVNWQIRNHQNGFVYVRQGVNPPASVVEAAKKAIFASGLDFGAVDVIWNAQKGRAYVLEINTAPGLEGQTVTDYADFFREL